MTASTPSLDIRETPVIVDMKTGGRRTYYTWEDFDAIRLRLGRSRARMSKMLGFSNSAYAKWKRKGLVEESTFISAKCFLLLNVKYRDQLIERTQYYHFERIPLGKHKFYSTSDPRRVYRAAYRYARLKGVKLSGRRTPKGVWIKRTA